MNLQRHDYQVKSHFLVRKIAGAEVICRICDVKCRGVMF